MQAVEQWPLDRLREYERNPRKNDHAVDQAAAAIGKFGFRVPILAKSNGLLIDGHLRLKAARQLGLATVPVLLADDMSDVEVRAFRLSVNKIADLAEWDFSLLRDELADLDTGEFDMSVIGFSDAEMEQIQTWTPDGLKAGRTDPDDIPPTPTIPITRPGDVWVLGRHRLICGDCTNEATANRLLAGAVVDLILTDPPYCSGGFQESGRAAGSVGTDAVHKQIANDRLSTRGYTALLKTAFHAIGSNFIYCFTDWRMWVHLFDVVESSGYGVRSMIVWDKGHPGMGRGWRAQHELIMFGAKKVAPFDKHASGAGNVIQSKRTGNVLHTTQKPVDVVGRLLDVTPFAEVVADPFAGSGTTLIACEERSRQCFAAEIDPAYIDVCINRWQAFTGKQATLDGDGRTFAEVALDRAPEQKAA